MSKDYDVAVVGAGIVGLAHAFHAARRGLKVAVFDRSAWAVGASIRNFGLVWPIGQPAGEPFATAMRSVKYWNELAAGAEFDLRPTGSIHLAYQADEWAVLEEFYAEQLGPNHDCRLLTPREVVEQSPIVNPEGLIGGLWSGTEHTTTSPEAIRRIPAYLAGEYGVDFFWQHAVNHIETGSLQAGGKRFSAQTMFVCNGADLESLFPELFASEELVKCKLQMLSGHLPNADFQLGPALCAGLTLLHYDSFAKCGSLPALAQRVDRELADTREHGVHILVSQHRSGELILGDSHHYGDEFEPFDSELVNQIILRELAKFTRLPDLKITRRWHGVYAKCKTGNEWVQEALPGVHLITGLGGAGMTLSLGLAEDHLASVLGAE